MLTFRSNGYDRDSLLTLQEVIGDAIISVCGYCDKETCEGCPRKLPQRDLSSLLQHLCQKIDEASSRNMCHN